MNEQNKLADNLLFGTNEEIIIRRCGMKCDLIIGDKSLFGVSSIELKIEAGQPLQYKISGEVVDC